MKTQIANKTITVLIRSKLDGCEVNIWFLLVGSLLKIVSLQALDDGKLQPVILSPKMEYQLEFGGNTPTKAELSKEWNSLFFRPFSKLYRGNFINHKIFSKSL